jgi:hypothetical protein
VVDITFPEIGDVDSLKGKFIYVYCDERSGTLGINGTGTSDIVVLNCDPAEKKSVGNETFNIVTDPAEPVLLIYRTVARNDYTRACDIGGGGAGVSDGVATAGALDVPNQEIDITVASPGIIVSRHRPVN